MDKLQPCPFCGSTGMFISTEPFRTKVKVYLNCDICPADMFAVAFNDDSAYGLEVIKNDLIEAWNRRSSEKEGA